MSSCSIKQCSARRRKNQPALSFHRYPKSEVLLRKWLKAIGAENINARHKDLFICSLHFEESQFSRTLDVIRLRDNAVPTLFNKIVKMRIRLFSCIVKDQLKPVALRDTSVVVDGQNYFYDTYRDSGLNHAFGCESDCYAAYLREHLTMFQKANIKCYFLFKGGHTNLERRLQVNKYESQAPPTPVFMWEIYKEIIIEMGFTYVMCEYESKRDTVALAQILDCPVISFDIEFCFSGVQYVPKNEICFNKFDNTILCKYVLLDDLLEKYQLTHEKLAVFIVLTDEKIFPEGRFNLFFRHIRAPSNYYKRNLHVLSWLSKRSREQSVRTVFQFISEEDSRVFEDEEQKARQLIGRREAGGLGAATALRRDAASVARGDPRWFAKGVAAGHVAVDYINLYRSKHYFNSTAVVQSGNNNITNGMLLCVDIIKYAYDLFTNFKNDGFTFAYTCNSGLKASVIGDTYSIRKPRYEAKECVFENGWEGLRERGLFEHFLSETLCGAALGQLARAPADARLLLAALLYFTRKTPADTAAAAAAVLTSYVALNVVLPKADHNNLPKFPFAVKPILESSLDKNDVTEADCNIAAAILAEYRSASAEDVEEVDWAVYHPLTQFQHCLSQMNHLNALCGAPYSPTVFHRTYSGTLVYRLARAARDRDPARMINELLSPAPTVYAFVNVLMKVYNELLST